MIVSSFNFIFILFKSTRYGYIFLYGNEQITFVRCFCLYFVIVIKILLDSLSYFVFGHLNLLFAFLAFDVSHKFQITNEMMVFNKTYY